MSFMIQDKWKKTQINNVRNEKGDTFTDPAYNKMTIRGDCEQVIRINFKI